MNIIKFFKGERGTHKGKVKVTRGGKTFYREQMIGRKDKEIINYISIKEIEERNDEYDQETIESISDLIEHKYHVNISLSDGEYGSEIGETVTLNSIESTKRGDGHKAMLALIDISQKMKYDDIHLEAFPKNNHKGKDIIKIVDWYKKLGFRVSEESEFAEIKPEKEYPYHTEFGTTTGIWMFLDLQTENNKSETINIKKMIGTHKAKVPVKRESGTHYEYRRVGKKSGRTGTGKLDKYPDSIKKEILEQRSYGESGAKIKTIIENMIETLSEKDQSKMKESKLIDDKGKLTVTTQALTDWAKKQGIDSKSKRSSKLGEEREKHTETKKDLDRTNKELSEALVENKRIKLDRDAINKSKMESDKIRSQLRSDNSALKIRLKTCLGK